MAGLFLFVLPLVSAQQHLSPAKITKTSGQQADQINLYFSQQLLAAGRAWAQSFRVQPGDNLPEVNIHPVGDLKELPGGPGILAVVNPLDLDRLRKENDRIYCLGREVYVPIVRSGHPLFEVFRMKGVPADAMEKGTIVADGTSIAVRVLSSRSEMEALAESQSNDLVFCRLADLDSSGDGTLMQGLALVPVDRNGNGAIDFPEDCAEDLQMLERALWIGKYPRELYSNMYMLTTDRQLEPAEFAFVNWLITEGRPLLAESGITGISGSEGYLLREKLAAAPVPDISPISYTTRPARGWIPYLSLAILAGIFMLPFLFFRRSPGHDPQVSGDISADGNGGWTGPVPGGLYFDRSHTWAFMEKDGTVRVGIDRFLPLLTGPLSRVEIPEGGVRVDRGDPLLTLIRNGKRLQVKSPVSGEIVELNPRLKSDPALLNRDPFGRGWICTLKPASWTRETRSYFMADYYRGWIQTEIVRLKAFFTGEIKLAGQSGTLAVLQDGGEPKPGILDQQGPEIWEEFQLSFIDKSD